MRIGIVGSEASKFTEKGKAQARDAIFNILTASDATAVVSGHCHLGGIDIWAEEIADDINFDVRAGSGEDKLEKLIFPPRELNWANGYKPRNLQIVHNSDKLYCITVDKLPDDYKGMRFTSCYHCEKAGFNGKNHVKSGGCWTVIQGMKKTKEGLWIIVRN